jgi:hypothetical protein
VSEVEVDLGQPEVGLEAVPLGLRHRHVLPQLRLWRKT